MINSVSNSPRINLNTRPVQDMLEDRSPGFAQRIKAAVNDVNSKQNTADDSIEQVIQGKMGIHEGMIAIEKAEVSLKLLAQVRNKVMNAYNEIMRMQV
jgi:flagellar hook-basal body complex protein FliE